MVVVEGCSTTTISCSTRFGSSVVSVYFYAGKNDEREGWWKAVDGWRVSVPTTTLVMGGETGCDGSGCQSHCFVILHPTVYD